MSHAPGYVSSFHQPYRAQHEDNLSPAPGYGSSLHQPYRAQHEDNLSPAPGYGSSFYSLGFFLSITGTCNDTL